VSESEANEATEGGTSWWSEVKNMKEIIETSLSRKRKINQEK